LNLLKRFIFTKGSPSILGFGLMLFSLGDLAQADTDKPSRARDLNYGAVLYEYYQGNTFDALSLLNVAKEKDGIKGHGDHPDLVEGGLLISYGMTREAKVIFENLLKEKLSVDDQNLAWFYLGKVFYLEQNYSQALDSFAKINRHIFTENNQEKSYELIYITSQITEFNANKAELVSATVSPLEAELNRLPANHIFNYYIRYNQAVSLINGTDNKAAIESFKRLINTFVIEPENGYWQTHDNADLAIELKALYNQTLLSLGQIYLQNSQNQLAFDTLKKVDQNSIFSEQALFSYAVAASNLKYYELALSALNTLNERELFNPWQQQTPYALAYLYEQLNEPVLAFEAYRAAVAKYEDLQQQLQLEKQALSEEVLLEALNIKQLIGTEALAKDAYGRVLTPKQQFSFAKLLTTEAFQRQLSELHELYLLKNSLRRWSNQLDSFEDSLDTRLLSRQQKLQATKAELALLEVDKWASAEQKFKQNIEQAIVNEDIYFFMTDQQIAYFTRLQKTEERLKTLPDDHEKKAVYKKRLQRAQAYFTWWINDEYPVNRWRTVKELKSLQIELNIFRKKHALLDAEKELDEAHIRFVERVQTGKERLHSLSVSLDKSLAQSSEKLIAQVNVAMSQQLEEIGRYLLASREALARVSDSLLVEGKVHNGSSKTQVKTMEGEL
jgi:hypothetical protein